ncbi:hypothetical protein GCM10023085_49210 [Actinomadura viridis]|uniref:Uncharacterized protein n=1 Tax=Actinomadura viridis TaxID=58110 RepID=A0A931DJI8_9ACTN|nr:hypothetical protein [Actinomadura viridis]MBG6090577.1 hypothetical protein [Actinomadura viridis]
MSTPLANPRRTRLDAWPKSRTPELPSEQAERTGETGTEGERRTPGA